MRMTPILCGFVLFASVQCEAQKLSNEQNPIFYKLSSTHHNLKVQRYKLTSPRLVRSIPTSANRTGMSYWTNTITSHSYGKGKFGTFYYWDVQGNLSEMQGFIDIAGKNKRGLKIVFPWH